MMMWVAISRAGDDDEGGLWVYVIYPFNMIILAFEFLYSSSCGLVIACHVK